MDVGMAGKVAVVTGASRGIGLAITQALVAEGASVVVEARKSSAELDELVRAGQVQVVEVDLAAADGPAQLIEQAGGQIDILVNNVGAAHARLSGFLEITDEDWLATLNLDLMAAVRTIRAALPVMLAAGHGAIVNVSSVNASLPDPAVMDYSAAKAALASFSKALSKEVGPRGVRVNTVSPGPVSTALWLGTEGMAASVAQAREPARQTSRARPPRVRRPAGSRSRPRSPAWSWYWPATAPRTSLAPTSRSTAA
jgi:NAD(P)-dependent dehydrogenase (short-subunit alcohol dehydrogenase family)